MDPGFPVKEDGDTLYLVKCRKTDRKFRPLKGGTNPAVNLPLPTSSFVRGISEKN